ncbi:Gfo/Idh/MocA family protein [Microvirga calopogonii]|uniref:Gfo/Idh/MocA family protein n=1 Tax=Microvirga calopogonii TaxID=2078013 RepID=UPI000E0DF2F0|nr:Gfo/Idh/MocA family oxidoreductase [Microvirga calopogonii]
MSSSGIRFAVIGINHNHIFGQVDALLGAGATFVSFFAPEDDLAAPFSERYPQAERVHDARRILEDEGIAIVLSAAIPRDRARIGIEVMRHGKDYMVDKPGMVTLEELAEVRRVQQETGRIYSIFYSEHFNSRVTNKAGELIRDGAIGKVVNTLGLGPHRLNAPIRPAWFFEREAYGGILTDIASHQCEQFLYYTGAKDAEVTHAMVANRNNPQTPGLQDFGEMTLRSADATGYIRVDWFTPDGLPIWGDGRVMVVGTDGYIEMRKYIDIAGREGKDHLFLVDRTGTRHLDCSNEDLPYGRDLLNDVRDRTETAMGQEHCFKAMELTLKAQALAEAAPAGQGPR